MELLKKILHQLNGLHFKQEYLCLAKEQFSSKLYAYLTVKNSVIKDITNDHVFAGYCPLIFALPFTEDGPDAITVCFTSCAHAIHTIVPKKDRVAQLNLKKIVQQKPGTTSIVYYEGQQGQHQFLSPFHQRVISVNNRLYHKTGTNVFLKNNLYKQVQIAYALPRTISLITVMRNDVYNLFPTDLHGPIDNDYYLISLRYAGKACAQVEAIKRIVITNVAADLYKQVYGLGKNHMQPMKSKDLFPFSEMLSAHFSFPLPIQAVEYRELELQQSFTYGIHKLLLFKIIHRQCVTEQASTLAHVHNSYATWRYKQHIESNYFLR